jgi:hypothetical protein
MSKKTQRIANFYWRMNNLGITADDADVMRRIEMTLHRWAEHECNGVIQRDDETQKPFHVVGYRSNGDQRKYAVADREAGAIRRMNAIIAKYPALTWYHQGDPRGCQVYVMTKASVAGLDVGAYYSSKGIAVCY